MYFMKGLALLDFDLGDVINKIKTQIFIKTENP